MMGHQVLLATMNNDFHCLFQKISWGRLTQLEAVAPPLPLANIVVRGRLCEDFS